MTLAAAEFGTRTLIGVVAGGFAYYVLGALWYMAFFRQKWLDATGRTKEEIQAQASGPAMVLTLGGAIVSTAVLAVVYQWAGGASVVDGAVVGALLGLGVAVMEGLKPAVYNFDDRARPWVLYRINALYAACGLTLAGVVFALVV